MNLRSFNILSLSLILAILPLSANDYKIIAEFSLLDGPEVVPCLTWYHEDGSFTEIGFDDLLENSVQEHQGIKLKSESDFMTGKISVELPGTITDAFAIWLKNRHDDDEMDFGKELPDIKVLILKNGSVIGLTKLQHFEDGIGISNILSGNAPKTKLVGDIPAGLWMVCIINPSKNQVDFKELVFPRTKVIAGIVYNRDQYRPVAGAIIALNGKKITQSGDEGGYVIDYKDLGIYKIIAEKGEFICDTILLDIQFELPKIQNLILRIPPPPPPDQAVFTSKDFYLNFAYNSDILDSSQKNKTILSEIIKFIKNIDRISSITVVGHTDSDGSEEYNLDLSYRRAKHSLESILTDCDSITNLISASGRGEQEPLVPNDSEENKAKNRRVEIKIEYLEN
ncbi:MAG: OmpA family protein [Bacteroidales bacterium]|nr:OmpA family protein [Bacteroidales bacterium]